MQAPVIVPPPPRHRGWVAAALVWLLITAGIAALMLTVVVLVMRSGEGDGQDVRARPRPVGGTPGQPVVGGTLHLAGSSPSTLDPAQVRDVVSAEYMYEIYSGLVTLSADLEVVPDLASHWDVSPDGRTYTFTLRSDAVFHDGAPVTAEAAAYGIERSCDPATRSAVASTYLGDIVGCNDKLAGKASSVAGLKVVDETHVAITIDAPKAYFLAKLTYPTAFALDPQQEKSDPEWWHQPNGSGPFRLATFEPDTKLVLAANERYYGGRPFLDEVNFDLRPIDAVTRYENGELDAVPISALERERLEDPLNPISQELVRGPGDLSLTYVGFNVGLAPFDDVHVRRAFNLALDKERLTRVILKDAVAPANGILPPGLPGVAPRKALYPFDAEKARAELAASRYGGPQGLPPIVVTISGEGGDAAVEALTDQIGEALGIKLTIEATPYELFQREVDARKYQAFVVGWAADYPDPENFLDVLLHTGSPLNNTGYSNPEVDRLLDAARLESDPARRTALYAEAEDLVLADAPWVPLYTGVDVWLVSPAVQGFTLPPIVVRRLHQVWLR